MDYQLRSTPLNYPVWGAEFIDEEARKQMDNAMRLPIAMAGALMPDAHVGYGLPIGGVLATENVVIPYAVGVDIACRMRLSVFEVSPIILGQQTAKFRKALVEQTRFGAGKEWSRNERMHHEVLDENTWKSLPLLRSLIDTAHAQLGTSGSGNHFVEWGEFELDEDSPDLDLKKGRYLALLSHSGSRGVGFQVANQYSKIARDIHAGLDKSVQYLSWLDLNSSVGQEYWLAMELSGRFASANHEVIHRKIAKAVGLKVIASVENHHNFAWKETLIDASGHEREVIVHRKGATPAGEGVLGVIPGSMGDAGYVVRGKGLHESINSASHGAGRQLSRTQAKATITKTIRNAYLKEHNVTLIGGDLDESPQAYKRIEEVIAAQRDLVDIVGKFTPRMVRMDGKE